MTIFEILTAITAIISIALVGVQIHLAAKALKDDHTRRRQQATLDYLIKDVRPHWGDELRQLVSSIGRTIPMSDETMKTLRANPQSRQKINKLLGNIEHMSVGVNMGVYDLEILDGSSGGFIINTFNRFSPYIRRRQIKQPTIYTEFEQLAIALCKRRDIPPPQLAPKPGTTIQSPISSDDA